MPLEFIYSLPWPPDLFIYFLFPLPIASCPPQRLPQTDMRLLQSQVCRPNPLSLLNLPPTTTVLVLLLPIHPSLLPCFPRH